MKIRNLILLFILFLLSVQVLADEKAKSILRESDRYRNGWTSFLVHTRITNYKNDKKDEEGNFEVLIKGEEKSLVRFLNPDQKGQYLLMVEDNMWIYMPDTRRPIRITPLQRLMGDASNGDVARSNFSRDYAPIILGQENIQDKVCFKLELKATNDAATYARIEYWIAKKSYLPMKAEIYLASGKHYKSISYDEYKSIRGNLTLTKMTLYDRLRKNRYTIMEFLDYKPMEIQDKYFNKNFLVNLK